MPREIEEIIEELENCFQGHDEYILELLAELKEAEDKALQEEREACARMADGYNTYPDLGKAIRARGENIK